MTKNIRIFVSFAMMMVFATSAQSQNWSGYYAGASVGSTTMTVEDLSFGTGPFEPSGVVFGGFTGYNFVRNNLVFSAEGSLLIGDVTAFNGGFLEPFTSDFSLSIRGRVGFDAGNVLPYIAVGYASSDFEADHENSGLAVDLAAYKASGISYAVGADIAVGSNKFLRIEYSITEYDDGVFPFSGGGDPHDIAASAQSITIGYGMRF